MYPLKIAETQFLYMKKIASLIIFIGVVFINKAYTQCETKNSITQKSTATSIITTVNTNCQYIVPDLRTNWKVKTTGGYSLVGTLTQIPTPGSLVFASDVCRDFSVVISGMFQKGSSNCIKTVTDRFTVSDKSNPVLRAHTITSANYNYLSLDRLKLLFTATNLYDNCSSLTTLRNNLEFIPDATRPEYIELNCSNPLANQYTTQVRTKDQCGNYSPYVNITFKFTDTEAPIVRLPIQEDLSYNSNCELYIDKYRNPAYADLSGPGISFSNRIIYPSSLVQNLTGPTLIPYTNCPIRKIVLRVCAQDCWGNGDLHLSDNGTSSNCFTFPLDIWDRTAPTMPASNCGEVQNVYANCTSIMPNMATEIEGILNNCGNYTVYQLPAPGQRLNDGIANTYGWALNGSGSVLSLSPELSAILQNDDIVSCPTTLGVFKTIPVSFIIIDEVGNYTTYTDCATVQLTNQISDNPNGLSASLESRSANLNLPNKINIGQNFPNPFSSSTTIVIESSIEDHGNLEFYNSVGQKIHIKNVQLQKGINQIQVHKNELKAGRMLFYTYQSASQKALPVEKAKTSILKMFIY
jgi:hypothetical protein